MKEKAKRQAGFATFGLRQGCRAIFVFTGVIIALMAAGFFACGYFFGPVDSYFTWSQDSRYLALERHYTDLVIYDLVDQTETVHANAPEFTSTWVFYDDKHLWIADYDMSGPVLVNYNVETQQVDSQSPIDYGLNSHINLRFTISPDHTSVAYGYHKGWTYTDDHPGRLINDLFQINLLTHKAERLTDTPDIDEGAPQYAPDGSLVVGDSLVKDGVWTKIPNFQADDGLYSISPDGQWILNYQHNPDGVWKKTSKEGDTQQSWTLVSQSRPNGLYLLPIDGHTEPQLIQNGPFHEIAWSPNGCYIAYSQAGPPRLSIVLASDWGLGEFVEPGADCKPYKVPSIFG